MLSTLFGLGGQPLTLKADPTVPINTNGVSQDITDRMRESFVSSGLRRNDGSIVEGTTGSFNTYVNNQGMIRRPSINSLGDPGFRQEGDMGRYIAFNDPGQPGAGFSSYQDYLDAGNPPVTGLTGTLGGTMIPGLVGGISPVPEGGPAIMPPNNTGIGSLTQNPINTTPESNMTGSMTSSGYLNNNQDLDQYLNSYVENLINRRMRDIFGGIMSIFQ